ncbi:hypothetical protein JYU29_08070 [Tianweitania sp. BSSL-BM11]|uniref:DUF3035 domain-containing protein n=1 Tax=Tianweitania aestuarii TaxID=2814886 RepID=A0ABS5RUA5_9HYPH|nr:hypothetical protein [Tianweitania aestuarii]MBS9720640.1 hypothetical protein [Tianweitania aestuarii]
MTVGRSFASARSASTVSIAVAALATLVLAGCTTGDVTNAMAPVAQPAALPQPGSATLAPSNTQDAAQQRAAQEARARRASVTADSASQVTSVQNTGAFPNLNRRPTAAAAQLSPEESAALLADLRSTQGRMSRTNAAAARSVPTPDELRRIGATHGNNTLQAISAEAAQ